MPDWSQLVTQVGIAATAAACNVWLVWYLVTKTLPDREQSSREDMAAERQAGLQSLLSQRGEFREMLQSQQGLFLRTLEQIERRAEVQHAAILARLDQLSTRLEKLEDTLEKH